MFAKIFTQILDSSLAEDWQTRHVFEDMLKLCDINGVVDMTPESIARRTNVPLEIVQRAIPILESPDPKSRSSNNEGRRIVRLEDTREWGWIIINHNYYRAIASEEQRRQRTLNRVRKFRVKSIVTHGNAPVTHGNASNAMQKQKQKQKQKHKEREKESHIPDISRTCPGLNEVFTECEMRCFPRQVGEEFWNHFESTGWNDKNGHAVVKWRPKLATWFARWREQNPQSDKMPEKPREKTTSEKAALERRRQEDEKINAQIVAKKSGSGSL